MTRVYSCASHACYTMCMPFLLTRSCWCSLCVRVFTNRVTVGRCNADHGLCGECRECAFVCVCVCACFEYRSCEKKQQQQKHRGRREGRQGSPSLASPFSPLPLIFLIYSPSYFSVCACDSFCFLCFLLKFVCHRDCEGKGRERP